MGWMPEDPLHHPLTLGQRIALNFHGRVVLGLVTSVHSPGGNSDGVAALFVDPGEFLLQKVYSQALFGEHRKVKESELTVPMDWCPLEYRP